MLNVFENMLHSQSLLKFIGLQKQVSGESNKGEPVPVPVS